jgi:hypothetical protein
MPTINKPQQTSRDLQVKAVDELINFYKTTKQPMLKSEIFTLYESMLKAKQELDVGNKSSPAVLGIDDAVS